jgi:transposase
MNRVRVRPPTAAERQESGRWRRAGKTVRYQRAQAVLLAADVGASGRQIARGLGLHPNTVPRWLHAFAAGGLPALAPRRRGGRAPVFGPEVAAALVTLLHERPEDHAVPSGSAGRWTLGDAAAVLAREGVVRAMSLESVRRVLRRQGHSWQRAKEWLTSPDPEYQRLKGGAPA